MEEIGDAFKKLADAIRVCNNPSPHDQEQLDKLEKMLDSFKDPKTFVLHVSGDLIINGIEIFKDFHNALNEGQNGNYEQCGKDIGIAMSKTFIGRLQLEEEETTK